LAAFLKQLRLHALTTVALEVRGDTFVAFEPPVDTRLAICIDMHGVHDTYAVECQRWLQASCLALSSSTNISLPDSSHVLSELVQRASKVTSLSLNGGCLGRFGANGREHKSILTLQDTELILRLTQLQKLSISARCMGFDQGAPEGLSLTQLVSSLPHLSELYFRNLSCCRLPPLNLAQSSLRVLHVSGKGWNFGSFPSTLQLFVAEDIYFFDKRWQTILLRDAPACIIRRARTMTYY
jgi:hypothetical protein